MVLWYANLMSTRNDKDRIVQDAADARLAFSSELATIVMPLLQRLKDMLSDSEQSGRLVDLIESNINHLVNTYQQPGPLSTAYQSLSPIEALVASMIRQGLPSKNITEILQFSSGTLNLHRKHIRKKLDVARASVNLEQYLKSLPD